MPSVTGYTAAKMQEIADAIIVDANVVANHLILTTADGGEIDAGDLQSGEHIPHSTSVVVSVPSAGAPSPTTLSTFNNLDPVVAISGFVKYRADTKVFIEYAGAIINNETFGRYEVAVALNGVNHIVCSGHGLSGPKTGIRSISGIPAGTYTATLLYRRSNGVGEVHDGSPVDKNSFKLTETF